MRDNIKLMPNYKPSIKAIRKLCCAMENITPCGLSFDEMMKEFK